MIPREFFFSIEWTFVFFFLQFRQSSAIDFFFPTDACTSMNFIHPTQVFSIHTMKNHDFTKSHFHLFNTLPLVPPKILLDHHLQWKKCFRLKYFFCQIHHHQFTVFEGFEYVILIVYFIFVVILSFVFAHTEISFCVGEGIIWQKKHFFQSRW